MWRMGLFVLFAWAVCISASSAQSPGAPSYLAAKPDDMLRAYGPELTGRVFSDEFTEMRQQAIRESLRDVPGLTCPKDAAVSLYDIYPFRADSNRPNWIERYTVSCNRPVRRGLLFALQGSQVVSAPLAPGESAGDPQLYSETLSLAEAQALRAGPKSCTSARLVDTILTERPRGGPPWAERWSFVVCGESVSVNVSYTAAADGGTVIRVSVAGP